MATLKPSTYCRYEFASEEEALRAQCLSIEQRQWFQTVLSDIAEERLQLMFDPQKPLEFAQGEANLKGQIEAIQYIMSTSLEAEEALKLLAARR